jgi:hypothetical protein
LRQKSFSRDFCAEDRNDVHSIAVAPSFLSLLEVPLNRFLLAHPADVALFDFLLEEIIWESKKIISSFQNAHFLLSFSALSRCLRKSRFLSID